MVVFFFGDVTNIDFDSLEAVDSEQLNCFFWVNLFSTSLNFKLEKKQRKKIH